MAQPLLPAQIDHEPGAWDQALYAFLAEKLRRSGSRRTVEGYARMLWPFFNRLGKTPDQVTAPDVLAWAHGIGLSGRVPSSTTVGARIACLSSFYRFPRRMELVASNPCDALERPRSVVAPARGLTAADVRQLLSVVPGTVRGRRDRAILLTLVLTGRRRTEVISLTVSDLSIEGETVFYAYRGKGGKTGRRELPRPAYETIVATLADCGKEPGFMWGCQPNGPSSGCEPWPQPGTPPTLPRRRPTCCTRSTNASWSPGATSSRFGSPQPPTRTDWPWRCPKRW